MSNNKKYGEETKMVSFRVPHSKETEIKQLVKLKLNEYEKDALMLSEAKASHLGYIEHPEKKSNPADNDSLEVVVENNPPKWAKKHKQVVKNQVSVDKNESESMSDLAITVKGKKKVDMDALRKIASGEGLKGEFQLTKKKVDIEEKYDFVYAKNIPDQDDQIAVDKKGIAFYSKYDLGVFYVKWEGKYIRFDEKAEFDRFANDNLIML